MTNILTSTTTLMSLVTKELKEELLKKQFCLHCTSSPILDPYLLWRTMSVISWASLCSKQISAKVFFLFKKVIATIKCSPITQLFETKSFETLEHSLENIISSGLVEVILQFCAPIYNSQQVQLKQERQVLNYCVTSLRNSHCCFCYTIYQYSWQNCYFRFSTQFRMSLEWFRDSKIQSEGIS